MANEATVRTSLSIRTGSLNYQSKPTGFQANVTGEFGPSPGAVTVSQSGTDIDFSEITSPAPGKSGAPGLCRIMNLDEVDENADGDSNTWLTYGNFDPVTYVFYPLGELLPGESYVVRLSRYLGQELGTGTGTGTTGSTAPTFRVKCHGETTGKVLVEAFQQ